MSRDNYTLKTRGAALARAQRYGGQFGEADAMRASDGLWVPVVWLRADQGWMTSRLHDYGVVGVPAAFAGKDEKDRYSGE